MAEFLLVLFLTQLVLDVLGHHLKRDVNVLVGTPDFGLVVHGVNVDAPRHLGNVLKMETFLPDNGAHNGGVFGMEIKVPIVESRVVDWGRVLVGYGVIGVDPSLDGIKEPVVAILHIEVVVVDLRVHDFDLLVVGFLGKYKKGISFYIP
jgi:hypothetical protein